MKRFFLNSLFCLLIFATFSCGGGGGEENNAPPTKEGEETNSKLPLNLPEKNPMQRYTTLVPAGASTVAVTLAWDPHEDPEVAGFRLYYKTNSSEVPFDGLGAPEGASPVDVGVVTQTTVTMPASFDQSHYFALTAYDRSGYESAYSNIVAFDIVTDNQINLLEITPVASTTKDTTPNYMFQSSAGGTISYGGGCSPASSDYNIAVIGNNYISFLSTKGTTYSNCTITVSDHFGNTSSPLAVTPFSVTYPGDLDFDHDVDIFDYNALISPINFGSVGCGNIADINGDCKVDIADFNLFMSYGDMGKKF
jgi:hypothetical protein